MNKLWKKHKKVMIISCTIGLLLMVTAGVTLARNINSTGDIKNEFTLGGVKTNLIEPFYEESPYNYVKQPQIVNNGQSSCLVRIRYEVSPSNVEELLEITGFGDKWKKAKDGWYYYDDPLAVGETTQPLFDHVKYTGTDEQWVDFEIHVYQESVQPEVYYDSDGDGVEEKITDPAKIWELYDSGKLAKA